MKPWAPFKSSSAREAYLAHAAHRAKAWPVASEERLVATSFGQTFVRPRCSLWWMCWASPTARGFMGWVAPELKAQRAAVLEELVEDGYLANRSFAPRKMVPPIPLTDAQWGQYQSKTLFLAGEREVIFPARAAVEKLARVAPHVETALLPGAGHDFFLVHADAVNRRVLAFLGAA